MSASFAHPPNRVIAAAGSLAFACVALIFALDVVHGSVTRDALIAMAVLAPFAVLTALVRPLLFPYSAYILLMPFDMFLGLSRAGTLTKMLGIVTGLLLLFYCLRTQRIISPGLSLRVLALLGAWAAISLLWAVDPSSAAEPLQTLLGLALLYAALAIAPVALSDFKFILGAIVLGYLIVACYGIASFHGVFPVANPGTDDRLFVAAGSHYIDPNEYADSLIFPLAVAMTFAFRARLLSLKLAGLAIACTMVTAIALSASREALIALLVVIAYYLWRSRYRLQLAIVTLVLAAAVSPFLPAISERFQTALTTGGAGRTSIWAVGLEAVRHYGLFGSGIGSFPAVYDRFYLAVPQTYLYGWSAPPHNVLLRYWVELGGVGLALVVLFVAAHFAMLRSVRPDHPLYDYRIMLEAGLLGLCVSAFFIDSSHSKWTWLVFATSVQLVHLAATYKRRTWTPLEPATEPSTA